MFLCNVMDLEDYNMREDAVEEDYVDDPIRLFDYEQSRVCYTELADIVIEDPGFGINITKEEEERFEKNLSTCRNKTSLLPITFFENDRNIELLSECCPLTINVVDCGKFVTYCEKIKDVRISSNVIDVSQNLTCMMPNRTIQNTTEVVSKQVFDQINLKRRETTSIANVNNRQCALTNKNKDHKIKNSLVDANVLKCPKLGTPIKSLNDELNVNRDHKQLMNNVKQTSYKKKIAVEKEINNILEKQLADIKSVKINEPGTKVIEHCQYKSISRTDIARTTVNLSSKNYDEQIMKFIMSGINRNESLKTSVMSSHVQKIDRIESSRVPLLPPKLSQTKTLRPDASTTMQCIQNKPCTKVMCDKRFFSANKEIPHYHNTSLTNTVINRQQEHNSNKTDYVACTGNINNSHSLNKDISISNPSMNNNYINNNCNISSLAPNQFISSCSPNYVINQKPKDNTNSQNMRININGHKNPPGLRDTSKGMSVIQTNHAKIPLLLNQNYLTHANNPQNFPIRMSNNFPQTYIQPPPPHPPVKLNIYNRNLYPPINNNLSGAGDLPLVGQNQPITYSNINRLTVRPNLPPPNLNPNLTQVSRAQSSFMENKERMINIRSNELQKNVAQNISNVYLPGTSTSTDTDQLNQSIKVRGYENKNIVILNKHPHLVKALEGQPMKKHREDTTKYPHLVKALEDQSIEKKSKDDTATKVINSNVISTVNNKNKTVRSNSATDTSVELNKINQNEPTKSNIGNNTIRKSKTSISDYKMVNNGTKGNQKSDNINKPAKSTTNTKDIKQNQLNKDKTLDINKPYTTSTTNVGYSPPILPIPSYQELFETLSKIKYFYIEGGKIFVKTEKTNDEIDYDIPLQTLPRKSILKKADKRKIEDENEKLPRKITISEYKERGQSIVNNTVDLKKVRK